MAFKARILFPLGAVCCLLAALGCSRFNLKKDIPWPMGEVDDFFAPTKVVAIWHDAVLQRTGHPATRGFGGRVMFYNTEDPDPVKVEGTMVVNAFDERGRDPNNVKPDRKYVFTVEQLPAHYSESKIGHSYSFWIPWDEIGGFRKEISLIVRFTPLDGNVLIGEQTKHVLPGPSPPGQNPKDARFAGLRSMIGSGVRQASYEAATENTSHGVGTPDTRSPQEQKMTTTTIEIPGRFGRPGPRAVPRRPAANRRAASAAPSQGPPMATVATRRPPELAPARRSTRSSPVGPQAQGGQVAPRALDRAPFLPHPAGLPSRPPIRPGAGRASRYGPTSPDDRSAPN